MSREQKIVIICVSLLLGLACYVRDANAQQSRESLNSIAGSVLGFRRDSANYSVDILAATQSEIARRGAWGNSTTSNTTIGTQNVSDIITNNGGQSTSGATNVVNSNQTSTNNTVGAGSNGVTIVARTGSTQYSQSANQGATAQTATSDGTSQTHVDAKTGPNG